MSKELTKEELKNRKRMVEYGVFLFYSQLFSSSVYSSQCG